MEINIRNALNEIRLIKPVILNVTNHVTMDFIANGLLSIGASPIMSLSKTESSDLVRMSKAIIINIGTLNEDFLELCQAICISANQLKIPLILDPVGCGATEYRTNSATDLLQQYDFTIIRGNASEILSLAGVSAISSGVDSLLTSDLAIDAAESLSKKFNVAVVVSGKSDFIVDQQEICSCKHGDVLLTKVTGAGCLLTATLGAFHAVNPNRFEAATLGTYFYALSAEKAAKSAMGPGSFRSNFLDCLATI